MAVGEGLAVAVGLVAARGDGLRVGVVVRPLRALAVGLGLASSVTLRVRATRMQPSSGSRTSPVTRTDALMRLFGKRSFSATVEGSMVVFPVNETTTVSPELKVHGPCPEKEVSVKATDPGEALRNNGASPAGVSPSVGAAVPPGDSVGDEVVAVPPGEGVAALPSALPEASTTLPSSSNVSGVGLGVGEGSSVVSTGAGSSTAARLQPAATSRAGRIKTQNRFVKVTEAILSNCLLR